MASAYAYIERASCTLLTLSRFDHALKALQHALILAPQNPFYVQQAAETAYTAGDVPLATKFFLGVVDMTEDPDLDPASRIESVPEGLAVRAWFGIKQVSPLQSSQGFILWY